MAKRKSSSDILVEAEEWTVGVVKRAVDAVCLKFAELQKVVEDRLAPVEKDLAEVKGKLGNGMEARMRNIERMQWWQIGIMALIIGGLVGGMWVMLQRGSQTSRDTQKLLLDHVNKTAPQDPGKGE